MVMINYPAPIDGKCQRCDEETKYSHHGYKSGWSCVPKESTNVKIKSPESKLLKWLKP